MIGRLLEQKGARHYSTHTRQFDSFLFVVMHLLFICVDCRHHGWSVIWRRLLPTGQRHTTRTQGVHWSTTLDIHGVFSSRKTPLPGSASTHDAISLTNIPDTANVAAATAQTLAAATRVAITAAGVATGKVSMRLCTVVLVDGFFQQKTLHDESDLLSIVIDVLQLPKDWQLS